MEQTKNLVNIVNKFKQFGSFPLSSVIKSTVSEIYKTYTETLIYFRSCFLMEMYARDSTGFFDTPTVPELFSTICSETTSFLLKYSPMYIQGIITKIQYAFEHPKEFADLIAEYFKFDCIDFLFFAYSTFPAIYSEFIGKEYCRSASLFLSAFFRSDNYLISSELLSSFFCSSTLFYKQLWINLSKNLANIPKKNRFVHLTQILYKCLHKTLTLLSKYHVRALKSFISVYPKQSISFISINLLQKPFQTAAEGSSDIIDTNSTNIFISFLEKLSTTNISNPSAQMIIDLFVKDSTSFQINPSLNSSEWSRGIPFLVCHKDIRLMNEIFQSDKSGQFKFYYDPNKIQFTDSLSPLTHSFYPSFDKNTKITATIGIELFGQRPPRQSFAKNVDNEKLWTNLIQFENRKNITETILNPPSKFDFIKEDKETYDYLLSKLINYYESNFSSIEQSILYHEHLKQLKDLNDSIKSSMYQLFHHFSFGFLQVAMRTNSRRNLVDRINQSISQIITKPNAPTNAIFEITCSALDTIPLHQSEPFEEMYDMFVNVINNWMESKWPLIKVKPPFSTRLKHILSVSSALSHLKNARYGKTLKIILQFESQLRTIGGENYAKYFVEMFHSTIFLSPPPIPDILPSFLFLHHFVFSSALLIRNWEKSVLESWAMFSSGIWSIIQDNQKLCDMCSDYKFCEKLFKL